MAKLICTLIFFVLGVLNIACAPKIETAHARLEPDQIRDVMMSHKDQWDVCLKEAFPNPQSTKTSKLKVHWSIDQEGRPFEVNPLTKPNSAGEETFLNCMIQNIKRYQFPRPSGTGTIHVTWPFLITTR